MSEKITAAPRVVRLVGLGQNEVALSPERGGIITSIKLQDTEILYLNQASFENRAGKVRGGIPILYPNAGPLDNDELFKLKQHGYARLSDGWILAEEGEDELLEILKADSVTRLEYPFDTELRIAARVEIDGSVTIWQEAKNLETDKAAPVAMGLHPYFRVKNADKAGIKFNFAGGEIIAADFSNWSEGGTTSIDNPKLADPEAVLRVYFPGLGTIVMDVSVEYRKIWVWTEPGQDFVCVEPVMRDPNGLLDDPALIEPGETLSAKVNYSLE